MLAPGSVRTTWKHWGGSPIYPTLSNTQHQPQHHQYKQVPGEYLSSRCSRENRQEVKRTPITLNHFHGESQDSIIITITFVLIVAIIIVVNMFITIINVFIVVVLVRIIILLKRTTRTCSNAMPRLTEPRSFRCKESSSVNLKEMENLNDKCAIRKIIRYTMHWNICMWKKWWSRLKFPSEIV